jgi:hypothetical protein
MWRIKIKWNLNITAATEDRHHQHFIYDFKFSKRYNFHIAVLWLFTPYSLAGSECSEMLTPRYHIPVYEGIANIYLPCKRVSESSKTDEGRAYHKQDTPKRWQQCWLLSPTGILDCLLMMQCCGWLEFFHSKACQEQSKAPILCFNT